MDFFILYVLCLEFFIYASVMYVFRRFFLDVFLCVRV